jgi:hypothetical protein
MLSEIVDPIIAAVGRHTERLKSLNKTKRPGGTDDLREESARACVNEIQNIVEPAYQAIVDAEADQEKKISLLGDSKKELVRNLVGPRLPQVGNRPHDGYYSIIVRASEDAARSVYGVRQSAALFQFEPFLSAVVSVLRP